MDRILISVLLGSARTGRQSSGPAHYLRRGLEDFPDVALVWLDLAEYRFPVLKAPDEAVDVPPGLTDFTNALARSDGILIVSPEYKGGYPGVLKNALDYLPPRIFRHKAMGICTTSSGAFGGLNCLGQLRLVGLALGGVPIPTPLPIPRVDRTFAPEGELLEPRLAKPIQEFLEELIWYSRAIANHRQNAATTSVHSVT